MAEPGVIWRDQVIAIGQLVEQRLKHPGRGREPVQQQDDRCVYGAGLAIKNRESIHCNVSIVRGLFHCYLDLEYDFQLHRYSQGKACDSIHQAAGILLPAKDVLQEVRRAIRDRRLVTDVP